MSRAPDRRPDEERRRLFRQMEWVFVWGPPLVAALVAVLGSALVAWMLDIPGTEFWQRWLAGVVLVLGLPAAIYAFRHWRGR